MRRGNIKMDKSSGCYEVSPPYPSPPPHIFTLFWIAGIVIVVANNGNIRSSLHGWLLRCETRRCDEVCFIYGFILLFRSVNILKWNVYACAKWCFFLCKFQCCLFRIDFARFLTGWYWLPCCGLFAHKILAIIRFRSLRNDNRNAFF